MLDSLVSLLPVFVGLAAGAVLRRLGVASAANGEFIFRLIFYVCAPALIFISLAQAEVTSRLLVFPAYAFLAISTGYLICRLLGQARDPVLLMACMIVNSGFSLPFIQALHGQEGLARLAAFDAVGVIMVFTWVHSIAARANPEHAGGSVMAGRLVRSPPLYATAAGLAVSLSDTTLPTAAVTALSVLGTPTGLLVTIAVGIMFRPQWAHLRPAVLALSIRMLTAVLLLVLVANLVPLGDFDLDVLLLLAVAPLGFNVVTFAALEKLDSEKAAGMLSLSLIVSCVLSVGVVVLNS